MKTMTVESNQPALQTARHSGKLFYRINEVARMTGLKPYVLRYWETEFRELSPDKDASDQRRYRPADIEVVLAIRKLLYEDRFTIEGARKRLREELRSRRDGAAAETVPTVGRSEKAGAPVPRRTRLSDDSARRLDITLHRLRKEVNDLINMLSA
ncbi:MAG: MerR family transcriptional regulator [bacterium]|nr:MerR family transcriptional regulator [bacterium]